MIKGIGARLAAAKNLLMTGESGFIGEVPGNGWTISGHSSSAGKTVNAQSAMTVSAVWACVKRTAELVSTLPVQLYEKDSAGNQTAIGGDLAEILTSSPNSEQTSAEYWEGMIAHLLLQGNSFAEKKFIGNRLVGKVPLFGITPERGPDGRLRYAHIDRGRKEYLPAEKVFHLRGFGDGSGIGMSPIKFGANSMGVSLAAEETAGKVFSNAMLLSGLLTSDQTLNIEQRAQLQQIIDDYTGSDKAGKILTLEAGLSYQAMQINPDDAQLLESRRFNIEDVCRWFGVPPVVIGHAAKGQTMWGSGVEAIMLSWLTTGVNPLLRKIEARVSKDLIPLDKLKTWKLKFNREAMLQMDSKAKGEFLSKMTTNGIMSRNEGREKLNLPRVEGGDALTAQMALAPIDQLGAQK